MDINVHKLQVDIYLETKIDLHDADPLLRLNYHPRSGTGASSRMGEGNLERMKRRESEFYTSPTRGTWTMVQVWGTAGVSLLLW